MNSVIPNSGFRGEHGASRQRLALARQAGYTTRPVGSDPEATSEWRRASKHLAEDARKEGFGNPQQYLYSEVQKGGAPQVSATAPLTIAERWNRIILTYGARMVAVNGRA